jgi:hypothetical protein
LKDLFDQLGLEHEISGKQKTVAGLQQGNASTDAANKALEERLKFRDKMVETYRKEQADEATHVTELSKIGEEWAAKEAQTDDKVLKERQRVAAELEKYSNDLADIQRHGADSLAQQSIGFALSTGTISAHAAAISLATLHTREYTQALADLQQQQRAADNVGDTAESQRVGRQIGELKANRSVQVQGDNQSISSTTSLARLQQMLTVNMPQVLTQTFGKFIENFNDALLDSKRGKFGKNIKNAAASGLRTIGKAGLQKAEGGLMGALGLGKKPMPVVVVGGLPGVGSTSSTKGGIFSKILGSLLPGFASGGDIGQNQVSIIGENGPEIFSPRSAGTITPNSKLRVSAVQETLTITWMRGVAKVRR